MPSEKSDPDVSARTSDEPSGSPSTRTIDVKAEGAGSSAAQGRRIGPYRVLREIGGGGVGTVYLAFETTTSIVREVRSAESRPGDGSIASLRISHLDRYGTDLHKEAPPD